MWVSSRREESNPRIWGVLSKCGLCSRWYKYTWTRRVSHNCLCVVRDTSRDFDTDYSSMDRSSIDNDHQPSLANRRMCISSHGSCYSSHRSCKDQNYTKTQRFFILNKNKYGSNHTGKSLSASGISSTPGHQLSLRPCDSVNSISKNVNITLNFVIV